MGASPAAGFLLSVADELDGSDLYSWKIMPAD
jgi:hypothetical protein